MEFFIMEEPPSPAQMVGQGWTVYVKKQNVSSDSSDKNVSSVLALKTFWQRPGEELGEHVIEKAKSWALRAACFFAADNLTEIEVLRRG